MAAPTSCTLIISIYNQAPQLRRVLETVARQSNRDFDIVIADDGSADAVEPVINAFREQHPGFGLSHLWHEDRGFHKTIILNKAYRAARGEYLIVIDGDMLLHDRFIENHLRHARPDRALCAYRGVKLGEQITAELLSGKRRFSQNLFVLLWQGLRGQLEEVSRGLVINNPTLRRLVARRSKRLSGCNFSTYRDNLFRVNWSTSAAAATPITLITANVPQTTPTGCARSSRTSSAVAPCNAAMGWRHSRRAARSKTSCPANSRPESGTDRCHPSIDCANGSIAGPCPGRCVT
jgi:hypothetical protein